MEFQNFDFLLLFQYIFVTNAFCNRMLSGILCQSFGAAESNFFSFLSLL